MWGRMAQSPSSKTMKSFITTIVLASFLGASGATVQASPADSSKAAAKQAAPKVFTSPQKEGTKASCPITGDEFTIAKDTAHAEYRGKHVYFCCAGCKKSFDKDPEKYTK
jgi:YHS domain-containing protein